MTVEELIDHLREMPPTAMVFVRSHDKDGEEIEPSPRAVVYAMARVLIKTERM